MKDRGKDEKQASNQTRKRGRIDGWKEKRED